MNALLALLLVLVPGAGPEISVQIGPEPAEVGLLMSVNVTIHGEQGADCALLEVPEPVGARLVFTRGPHRENIMRMVNGRRAQSVLTTWQFELVPEQTGTLELPVFRFQCRGQEVTSEPRSLEVGPSPLRDDIVTLEVSASTEELWVGQVAGLLVRATVLEEAFDRIPRGGLELNLPWLNGVGGLHLRNVTTPDCDAVLLDVNRGQHRIPVCRERVVADGATRLVFTQTVPLLATEAGTFRLPDSRFSVRLVVEARRRDPMDVFSVFDRTVPTRVAVADAVVPGVTLRVRETPTDGRPPDYTNAVGRFRLRGEVAPRKLRVGESCQLALVLTLADPGSPESGNLDLVTWPAFEQLTGDFRIYGKDEQRSSRERVLQLEISPKRDTVKAIPELPFAYFDPVFERYETITVGPFELDVTPGGDGGLTELQTPQEFLNDLETIREQLPEPAARGWPAWTWTALAAAVLLFVELRLRLRTWQAAHPREIARRGARRGLERALAEASDTAAVAAAFARYLSARLDGPAGGLTAEEAAARLDEPALAIEVKRVVGRWEASYLGGAPLEVERARADARRLSDRLEVAT